MKFNALYLIAAATFSALSAWYVINYINRKKRLLRPPLNADWKFVGVVEEITISPVTSVASIRLNEAQCDFDGLYSNGFKDRSLVLHDENDQSVFAGTYPKMLSITTEMITKTSIVLKAPHSRPLTIDLQMLKNKQPKIQQKQGYKVYLVEGELDHHKWFSEVILNKSEGLKVYLCLKMVFEHDFIGEDKSDFMPIMLMNSVSVDDLNQRLSAENQVHHLQFRGNVLIKSADNVKPYDEDNWKWLRFGEEDSTATNCILRYKAPCLRCILPNVNIETFKRNPILEPLRTLITYRLVHNPKEPTLGAYYKIFQKGTLKLKDPVYAIVS